MPSITILCILSEPEVGAHVFSMLILSVLIDPLLRMTVVAPLFSSVLLLVLLLGPKGPKAYIVWVDMNVSKTISWEVFPLLGTVVCIDSCGLSEPEVHCFRLF